MASYFVTGGTGFIGRAVVARLAAADRDATIYVLVRDQSLPRFERLIADLGHESAPQVVPVPGDITEPGLGISPGDLPAGVDHVIHLAALYDMEAPEEAQQITNVDGTRNVIDVTRALGATLHHVSSLAVAGNYEGRYAETDFDVGQSFPSPYHRTKYEAEQLVRESDVPWQVYRPSIVVGDSVTGAGDKIDGPYYFFPFLRLMGTIPHHLRVPFANLGYTNIVPVDFVASALVALVTTPAPPGTVYHLADPKGQSMTTLYDAVAPAFSGPKTVSLPGAPLGEFAARVGRRNEVRALRDTVARQLGIPPSVLDYPFYNTRFDSAATHAILRRLGVRLPRLKSYGPRIFQYWAQNLDPARNRRDDPRGPLVGKHILLTGGSSGIGKEAAKQAAAKGAHVFIVARKPEDLAEAVAEIEAEPGIPGVPKGTVRAYQCDVTDPEAVRTTVQQILAEHGHVDVLVNGAGRSIRRSTINSVDRAHDYQRTMAVNYFGAVYLILELLPHMTARKSGHVVNLSSIGVQVRGPRFAAYIASKSALEAFSDITASETVSDHVTFTNIHMPLTRTRMIEPTEGYDNAMALSVEKAGQIVVRAIVERPRRIDTPLGTLAQFGQFLSPRISAAAQHQGYLLFPESAAAEGRERDVNAIEAVVAEVDTPRGRLAATKDLSKDLSTAVASPLFGISGDQGLRRLARKTLNRLPGINW
ncbi:Male sterility domain protein OS=Tsukamurella paurometabola (strain ATCC 8368 / DSM / CCUG 35730/ CIP 100753 / JCM 10117 / KCTC 9821 / NBRC 16120 / NCIMB 702349 / NCTC 13040) OX=521096 GN=Tpau_1104 PE=3 SV=1 [Tsukamurella paurometabola]|uniref:Male sterility domain protein n=1 Tax=Tsukamurella paurometabola (strain ATCC 8368 / DSM 20162 / CCUG 35730 / CIP 100753 / JCM 10117 / KCTC 9821 / NBRC 16120 / NCIMB 702349 / NCTC 13040) TaxID=521096 RepID=D5UVE6_TSUPD|nr:SDR family oxidoreductase [Tsukamurella paurometabola]ADG77736.1 Male sterility domain protein [Tsukamurella paurometabola DSM 20162]SUP28554.1 Fatty acyl-CoA reductase [Tsukamurella paurometabola]